MGSLAGRSREELKQGVEENFVDDKNAGGTAGQLWRFANEIAQGDFVLCPDGQTREIHVGVVTGPYEFREAPPVASYPNVRAVKWERKFSRDELPKRMLYQVGGLMTVFKPSSQEAFRSFLVGAPTSTGVEGGESEGDEDAAETGLLYDELKAKTSELISAKVAELDGYETQDLVAGILRSLGYFTDVAAEGKDGGVDVRAAKDPLMVEAPLLKVQVKARPNSSSGPAEIRELAGLVDSPAERGFFVATGGFTRDAAHDAKNLRIELIDMDRLVDLLLENYDNLDQETQGLIPLRRLLVP